MLIKNALLLFDAASALDKASDNSLFFFSFSLSLSSLSFVSLLSNMVIRLVRVTPIKNTNKKSTMMVPHTFLYEFTRLCVTIKVKLSP